MGAGQCITVMIGQTFCRAIPGVMTNKKLPHLDEAAFSL
jgi:hypothetical protein